MGNITVIYDGYNRGVKIQQQTVHELKVIEITSREQLERVLEQLEQMKGQFSSLAMSALGLDDEEEV